MRRKVFSTLAAAMAVAAFAQPAAAAVVRWDILESSLIGAPRVKLLPRIRDRSHGSLASLRGQRWAAA